jgi:hypothetical protein
VEVTQVAKVACESSACPTIFATDRGTVLVQGYRVPDVRLDVPAGEYLVEIPRSLLVDGAAGLQHHG